MLNFETFYGNSEPIAVIGLSGRFLMHKILINFGIT